MYHIVIGLYLLYNAKNNLSKLFSLGYGISSFSKLDWVLLVLTVLMIPLGILMLIKGYKEIKARKEKEQETLEEAANKKEDLYSEFSDKVDITDINDSESKFDS